MTDILVLYYSRHGTTEALARQIAKGIEKTPCQARIRTVPPLRDYQSSEIQHVPENGPPFVSKADLNECAGLAMGSPTRFGNMAAPLKHFLDSTSEEWLKGALIDKPCSVFTSSASMHGGQETTLLTMAIPLIHHGMIFCGLPYSESALHDTQTGGTPYGASHVSGLDNIGLSEHEKQLAMALGQRLATLTLHLEKSK